MSRASKALCFIWGGFYLFHLAAWAVQFSIPLTGAHLASILVLLSFVMPTEAWTWLCALAATAIGMALPSIAFAPLMLMVALAMACQARRLGRPRLWVAAILALRVAVWTIGWTAWPLPVAPLWLTITTGMTLIVLACMIRNHLAWISACAVILSGMRPHTLLEWGITITLAGFISLVMGIAINWNSRHQT